MTVGAHDAIYRLPGEVTRQELPGRVDELKREAEWEYGHDGYNGTISTMHGEVEIVRQEAAAEDEARDYILDHHEKWSGPLAMKVTDGPWLVGGWAAS